MNTILDDLWLRLGDTKVVELGEVTMTAVNYSQIVALVDQLRKAALSQGAPEPSESAIDAALNVLPERKFISAQPYGGTLVPELSRQEMSMALQAAYAAQFWAAPAVSRGAAPTPIKQDS